MPIPTLVDDDAIPAKFLAVIVAVLGVTEISTVAPIAPYKLAALPKYK